MELHIGDHNLPLSSLFSITDSDIPSFEEAFDTESLKRFYRQKDSFIYSLKEFSVEEDTRSQTLESFSPVTPAQHHSFMDYFQASGRDNWQDMFGRSNQTVDRGTSDQFLGQKGKSQVRQGEGKKKRDGKGASKQQQSKGDDGDAKCQDMIAKLCMEMQNYYQDPTAQAKVDTPVMRQAQPQQQTKKSNDKKTSYNKKEEELHNGVIKRLIQKKPIFKIHRKKGPQVPQTESPMMKPVVRATFSPVQQAKPQKKIAIELMTQTLPASNPVVEFQDNFLNQEKREKISFQLAPQMNFNMGNNNMRVSNMNIKSTPQSLLKYLS